MPSQLERELIGQHRLSIDTLTELALADLSGFWRSVDQDAYVVQDELLVILTDLIALYGAGAAALGADWYDDMRDASGAPGRFRALAADLPDIEGTRVLVRWGTGPLFSAEPDVDATRSLIEGGYQKIVADADRSSVFRSLNADPEGRGWSRQTTGKSCPFCVFIAARGAVFSASTAGFSSHNHCDCVAVPAFGEGPVLAALPYTPSEKLRTQAARDANSARLRQALTTP